MISWILIFSRYGKIRLKRWFSPISERDKTKISTEVVALTLGRKNNMCNILENKGEKIVYKRYASLFFCCCIGKEDNELITLEIIHRYVQLLDEFFGNVCELDIIYGSQHAYMILDELLINGEMQDTSKDKVMSTIRKSNQVEALESLDMSTDGLRG